MGALLKTGLVRVGALAVIGVFAGWCDQKEAKPEAPAKASSAPARPPAGNPKAPPAGTAKGAPAPPRINVPLNPVQRFLMMTPEEQERVLEKAPPAEQGRLRQAIDRFNQLTPQQRARVIQQYKAMSALPPAQQALLTRQMNAFNKLPDERRGPMRRELLSLLGMSPAGRESRLSSEDFKSRYSPDEQQMLRDLAWNWPPGYPLAGRPPAAK
jgi:hypothetical protein